MKYILMDVEGTTTSISFVHETLFPYSSMHLKDYVEKNQFNPSVQAIILETKLTIKNEESIELDNFGAINQLLEWIKQDRKHPALKKLQGLLWEEGYQSGELKGHVYPDVPVALKNWLESGIKLGIYSSGSIEAQRALFGHSLFGDLNSYFAHNFDTSVGHKRDPQSYINILAEIKFKGSDVLFLSDIVEELEAAQKAGIKTIQLVRGEEVPYLNHRQIRSFSEIAL